jgi:hypothetical protein
LHGHTFQGRTTTRPSASTRVGVIGWLGWIAWIVAYSITLLRL